MLIVQEVWLDMGEEASTLRMSVKPEDAYDLNLHKGQNLMIDIAGRDGLIGKVEVAFVAFIKGLAMLEVVRISSADAQSPHPLLCVQAFSEPRREAL